MVTVSTRGYIKRQPLATYRRQIRGGKGIIGARTVEEDAVEHLLVARHARLGAVLHQPGPRLQLQGPRHPGRRPSGRPRASRSSTSRASSSSPASAILAIVTIPNFEKGGNMVMATRRGHHQEDADRAVRARSLDGHPRHHRRRGRRAGVGCGVVRARRHHPGHGRRARSLASTRRRCGRWAATQPA